MGAAARRRVNARSRDRPASSRLRAPSPSVNLRRVPNSSPLRAVLPFVIVIAAGLFAYHGTWNGDWVYDDFDAIAQNPALLACDWWNAAFGPHHQPLANRPLSCLSLAIDFAVFGKGPFGPHLTNLLLHLGNGGLVLLVVRRCLLAPVLAGRFAERHATGLATAIAAVWVAHPLGGDSVCYATQRSTVLFSGWLLLSFFATLRSHTGERRVVWQSLAVAAMALAMASKEDAVVGPLLVVLLERAFVLPSWRALLARRGFHFAMAATWLVLAVCVWLGPSNATVGYATGIPVTAWQWLMTQAGVIVYYLRLVVWPAPLRTAYDVGIVQDAGAAVLPGLFVSGLLVATIVCWKRRPWWGWLGAVFFLLLAPTSSVMPIVSEVAAERRMYLPMLLVLVTVVVAADRWLAAGPRAVVGTVAVVIAVIALGLVARTRVAAHRDAAAFWLDAWSKRDPAARSYVAGVIAVNYGDTLWRANRAAEAYACYDAAMLCESQSATAKERHAMSLLERGRPADAVASLRRLAASSASASTLGMLGIALHVQSRTERGGAADPRLAEAEDLLVRSLAIDGGSAQFWSVLADVRTARGRRSEAAEAARRARELEAAAPRAR